ncbi:hypothetical protein CUJ83_09690 [Methanocella sp. CWC-04]|uniref:DUF8156 domain-containing protein n=1 Tax=Methanooceanicella nereidis TaxID=2052831 RepID=A0AAP2RFR1_9EURY|nr:hypothetical protein [Methanocella sp. CWC-04]MCD1295270.1 hypothetical protein [Methanocella sp. CWC-04]
MPGLKLMKAASKWEGYRMTLDKGRREIFDYLLYELAGRREETLVNHPNNTEAAMMNILIEMEMRIRELERNNKL